MIYRFLILSDEVDDFAREISIDSENTFFDLHLAILDSVDYTKNQITSFFLCSDTWEKEQEITLLEMESNSEYDNVVMDKAVLRDFFSDEGQHLLYVYDAIADRMFFIELKEIVTSKYLKSPQCTFNQGTPPLQIIENDNLEQTIQSPNIGLEESFYGDEGFDIEELDEDGFSDLTSSDTGIDEQLI